MRCDGLSDPSIVSQVLSTLYVPQWIVFIETLCPWYKGWLAGKMIHCTFPSFVHLISCRVWKWRIGMMPTSWHYGDFNFVFSEVIMWDHFGESSLKLRLVPSDVDPAYSEGKLSEYQSCWCHGCLWCKTLNRQSSDFVWILTHCGREDLWKWSIFNTILTSPKSWLSQEDLDAGCEHSLVPMDS